MNQAIKALGKYTGEDLVRIQELEEELEDTAAISALRITEFLTLKELTDAVEKHVFRREGYIHKGGIPGSPPEVLKGLAQSVVEENTAIIKACVNWVAANRMGRGTDGGKILVPAEVEPELEPNPDPEIEPEVATEKKPTEVEAAPADCLE